MLKTNYTIYTFVLFLMLLTASVQAQIVINEFSASNATQIEDADYEDYSDWIELYNPSSTAVNLKGYYLTDNLSSPDKWEITENISIAAGGFLLIWADGNDESTHTSFKLSADGEEIGLYSAELYPLDTVIYTVQQTDVSFGRKTDGDSEWGYFTSATPEAANTTTVYSQLGCATPEFSVHNGFYTSTVQVELSSYQGGNIYYTLDGSDPQLNSSLYTSPLDISVTTIVRARIFKTDCVPGTIATSSFFIHENAVNEALPVVSIATDPGHFWDADTGIYVQDYKPEWEVPINIEFFENNGSDRAAFNELAGTKVNGLYSWELPQKMLGIYFRKQYGSSNLDYKLTWQRDRSSYKNFSLRASGSDWSYTLFRDVLGQQSTLLNMDIDIMGYRPAIVYVNGEYMGIHNIREKVDDDYIEKSYDLESGTFDMIENETYAEEGDLTAYNSFLTLLEKGLSNDANYEAVADVMDIENFTDYIIAEMAVCNTSISHNIMAWKPSVEGKWKWILMDLDRGFGGASSNLISFYKNEDGFPLNELLDNATYKTYFGKRMAAQLYTSFNPIRMKALIVERKAAIAAEMPNHITRWKGATSDYGDAIPSYTYWESEIADIETFVENRADALLSDLENYGFSSSATLSLNTYPSDAGSLAIEHLALPENTWSGSYLTNIETMLSADDSPGYTFKGWAEATEEIIIASGDDWKYNDTGGDLGSVWTASNYDDTSWDSGPSELGYGDDDEATEVDYGTSSSDKHITTYFRKIFNMSATQQGGALMINLLKDDGALVYVNGVEVIRANMDTGAITYESESSSTVSGSAESTFTSYSIASSYFVEGSNTIAVEVHQNASNSSDLSFDLELSSYRPDTENYISTSSDYELTMTGDTYLTAVYANTSACLIPEEISDTVTLDLACSPYLATGDITIETGALLIIDAGVEIQMPEGASLNVNGVMQANGTSDAGIRFVINPQDEGSNWGIISFSNTAAVSTMQYVTIEDASIGEDLVLETAAITAFNADLVLDHLIISNVAGNPIMARYSDISLTNSNLTCDVTGDLINVKYGKAFINNCQFTGNSVEDADAIDYDEIEDGVIKNCTISGFFGSNSDAIDIGEKTSNLLIDSVAVNGITDKGVSLGQQSSAIIKNSVFLNCYHGIAVKDSSVAEVSNCVFYGNVNGVSCYEKNLGDAGGNASIMNSILSNISDSTYRVDAKSQLVSSYCLTDELESESSHSDLSGNPQFESPTYNIFSLLSSSPAIEAGVYQGSTVDIGTFTDASMFESNVLISQFFINAEKTELPEFLALYNPSNQSVDLSNYTIAEGITDTIPEGTYIAPGETIYLTKEATANAWWDNTSQIIEWQDGKLSNSGETLKLYDSYGILRDFFTYEEVSEWPSQGFEGTYSFQLRDVQLDNHFGKNWEALSIDNVLDTSEMSSDGPFLVYPNPTDGLVNIKALDNESASVRIYNFAGQLMGSSQLDDVGLGSVDLSAFPNGVYMIVVGVVAQKVLLMK